MLNMNYRTTEVALCTTTKVYDGHYTVLNRDSRTLESLYYARYRYLTGMMTSWDTVTVLRHTIPARCHL